MKLREIAEKIGAKLLGDGEKEINWVGSFEHGQPDQISFITNAKYLEKAKASKAGAFVVGNEAWTCGRPALLVPEPYRGFVEIENLFLALQKPEWGIHPTAIISKTARLGNPVWVGPHVVIEDGVEIGDRCRIDAHCFIGKDCKVGPDTHFFPRVTVLERCAVGARGIFFSGTVIGGEGFGFLTSKDGHTRIPQLGTVEIGDDVRMGACCMIDCASLDKTVIGSGSKFDDGVHVAHSCLIGRNVILLAGVVLGGSIEMGDKCSISGNVTIRDHVKVAPGTSVIGGSTVAWDITEPGVYVGYPAYSFDKMRSLIFHYPEWVEFLEKLKKEYDEKAK